MPTPKSILSKYQKDIFEESINDREEFYIEKREILWQSYRNRGIGHCDIDYFLENLKDRYDRIKSKYDIKIEMYLDYKRGEKDLSQSSSTYESTTENEDFPNTIISEGDKYLAARNSTKMNTKTYNDLQSKTLKEYNDNVTNPLEEFANEFRDLFYFGV